MNRRNLLRLLSALPFFMQIRDPFQQQKVIRRRVVPLDVIIKFKLQPTNAPYGPFLLGEDGKSYDFDDVVAVIFEITKEHWQLKK